MAAREALAARIDHKTLLVAYKQVVCRQILGGAAQFFRAPPLVPSAHFSSG
jgi:hypothetical protein